MRLKFVTRFLLPAALAAVLVPAIAQALPTTRTIHIHRPTLLEAAQSGPGLDGPGGARGIAGRVTLVEANSATRPGTRPEINALSGGYVFINPPGCSGGVVTVVNDSFYVSWSSTCVDPGESAVIRLTSSHEISHFLSGKWRDAADVPVADATGEDWGGVPGLTPGLALVLAALLALVSMVVVRRRAATT